MKILMLFSAFFLVLSALGFAADIRIGAIDAPSQILKQQSFDAYVWVENFNIFDSTVKIECGVYADRWARGQGLLTIVATDITNCAGGSELFVQAKEISLIHGDKGWVKFNLIAPYEQSVLKDGTSNWDTSHEIICGLYTVCGGGYTNNVGEKGIGAVWNRKDVQVVSSLSTPSTPAPAPTPQVPSIPASNIKLLSFDFNIEGKKIIGVVKMKNEGASMSKLNVIEMQVRPQGEDPLAVFQSEQQICDPAHPENIHKSFQIGANEYAEVSLVSNDLPDGTYSVYFMSRDKCYNEAPVGNSPVAPFPFSSGRQDITIGNPPKGFDPMLLIIGIIILVGGFLVVRGVR